MTNSVPSPTVELQLSLPGWVSSTIYRAIAKSNSVPLPTPLVVKRLSEILFHLPLISRCCYLKS
ncbi:MAG: hypothetical protein AAF349_13840 [Cyanobacteria bacterium P01_A01_bin.68]